MLLVKPMTRTQQPHCIQLVNCRTRIIILCAFTHFYLHTHTHTHMLSLSIKTPPQGQQCVTFIRRGVIEYSRGVARLGPSWFPLYSIRLYNCISKPKMLVLQKIWLSKLCQANPVLIQIVQPLSVLYRVTLWVGSNVVYVRVFNV